MFHNVTKSQNFLFQKDMIIKKKEKEEFIMKVVLDKKLRDYMNEKEEKDIILYTDMCNT